MSRYSVGSKEPTKEKQRVDLMELRPGSLFANLLTIGNGVCGFAALVELSKIVEPQAEAKCTEYPDWCTRKYLLHFSGTNGKSPHTSLAGGGKGHGSICYTLAGRMGTVDIRH